ncbi:hypothetical protein N7537_008964 [Penicillium hordei]|uniref:D-isomer specific 2-hydroxyacid dehydrogenase NAD-binding domain-containing protein n=1 Tax=Penicillium hordei TaxID=40994 RepID=A0AAD6DSM1_9EURO|nr:uncharacterized protein N7537_008964 [Penicillium hordei]KAJ5592060.1 hypothetical protein N7537_008964 [Penicillium hordei]
MDMCKSLRDPEGKAPRICSEEVVVIIWYGEVGQQIAIRAQLLGMKVLVSGRKGAPNNAHAARVPFETVLRNSSVVFVTFPRVRETMKLISHTEFGLVPRHAILINISRGGIVDEGALIMALKARQIAGAATDVFLHEPASLENSVLLCTGTEDLNLVVTPHSAWFTKNTRLNFMACLQKNIVSWVERKPCNLVV